MKRIISFIGIVLIFTSCSLFQETTSYDEIEINENTEEAKDNTEEVYVFDETNDVETETKSNSETSPKEIEKVEKEVSETITENNNYNEPTTTTTIPNTTYEEARTYTKLFYLQLGAFSTLQRAERFSSSISVDVPFSLSIIYNSINSLYIVRSSSFDTRAEVEVIRNDLRRRNIFRDCFIVTD